MRTYGIIVPAFYTGPMGQILSREARVKKTARIAEDAQRVAVYLACGPHATAIGLYFLPLLYLQEEIGITRERAVAALDRLERNDLAFAFYDLETQHVWVPEMAKYRLGDSLKDGDHRIKWVNKLYQTVGANPFLEQFWNRYHDLFFLEIRRVWEGPSKGLLRAFEGGRKGPDTVPELDLGISAPVEVKKKDIEPEITVAEVISTWNTIEGVVQVKEWKDGEGVGKRIAVRIREHPEREWWAKFFNAVRRSKYLRGEVKEWAAPLNWSLAPENLRKILEGNYEDRAYKAAKPTTVVGRTLHQIRDLEDARAGRGGASCQNSGKG